MTDKIYVVKRSSFSMTGMALLRVTFLELIDIPVYFFE